MTATEKINAKINEYRSKYPAAWRTLYALYEELHNINDEDREDEIMEEIAKYATAFQKKHGLTEGRMIEGLISCLF